MWYHLRMGSFLDKFPVFVTAVFFLALPIWFVLEWRGLRRLPIYGCAVAAGAATVVCVARTVECLKTGVDTSPVRFYTDLAWFAAMACIFSAALWTFWRHTVPESGPKDFWRHNRRPLVTSAFAGWCLFGMIAASLLLETMGSAVAIFEAGVWSAFLLQPLHTGLYAASGLGIALWAVWIIRRNSGKHVTFWRALHSPVWNNLAPKLIVLMAFGFGVLFTIGEQISIWFGESALLPAELSGGYVRQAVVGSVALLLAVKCRATLRHALDGGHQGMDWAAMWPDSEWTAETAYARLLTLEIDRDALQWRTPEALEEHLKEVEGAEVDRIGESRAGTPLWGVRVGQGPRAVSVIAGCHADEPVGPITALLLPGLLRRHFPELLDDFRFHVIPQMNPDGAVRNRGWFESPLPFPAYAEGAVRETPGDDIEFGFDTEEGARPECLSMQQFLKPEGPFHAHFSLHGKDYAEGAWFLLSAAHETQSEELMGALSSFCGDMGMPLHDVDRRGEKGFVRIGPGFSTTPNSAAMRDFFLTQGDAVTAALFRPSSMEFVSAQGGEPLCMVSEVPMFRMAGDDGHPGGPVGPRFKADLEEALRRPEAERDAALEDLQYRYELATVPLELHVRLQLAMIVLALVCGR